MVYYAPKGVSLALAFAGLMVICSSGCNTGPGPSAKPEPIGESQPVVGKVWTVPDLGIVLVPISPGAFSMGLAEGDGQEHAGSLNHQVVLTHPFWMARTELTRRESERIQGVDASDPSDAELPVTSITWQEASNLCVALTKRERLAGRVPRGYEYRLPTEAEWEYCCRAGTEGAYSFGEDADQLREYGWFMDNSRKQVHPVASKRPNAWGLYDMHGNAAEWCLDWIGPYPTGSAVDPVGVESGQLRVLRGGSALLKPYECGSAWRSGCFPANKSKFWGVRIVLGMHYW